MTDLLLPVFVLATATVAALAPVTAWAWIRARKSEDFAGPTRHAGSDKRGKPRSWIRKAEKDSRGLLDHLPHMVARYDREARGVFGNRMLLEAWGLTAEEFVGRQPVETFRGEFGGLLQRRIEGVLARGSEDAFETRLEPAAGGERWNQVRVVPERDGFGAVSGVVVIGHDVSELKRVENSLTQSRELLRRLAAHRDNEQEKERKRIAHGLHEEVAQILAVLGWELKRLRKQWCDIQAPVVELEFMSSLADRALGSALASANALRSPALSLGLVPALHELVARYGERSAVCCPVQFSGEELLLGEEREILLYRTVEALLGALFEGAAPPQAVTVTLACEWPEGRLWVEELNPAVPEVGGEALGFVVAQEFAMRLGGEVEIASVCGKGRRVQLSFPVSASPLSAPDRAGTCPDQARI